MYFTSSPGSGPAALLKIVNIRENKNYSLSDVEFSLPEINTEQNPVRNTKVTMYFLPGSGYLGKRVIYYNRIHSSALPALTVLRGTATTFYELIPVLNSTHNLRLNQDDIVDGPLPDVVSSEVTVTLNFSVSSYLYYSTTEVVTVGEPLPYSLTRPGDVLSSNYCVGFDKFGIYTAVDGATYHKLIQTNSYDCGYVDSLERVDLVEPTPLTFLVNEQSGLFTLNLINPANTVTVNLYLPANLTATQSSFVLSPGTPSATFTVTSTIAGNYQIEFTNNGGLTNPDPVVVIANEVPELIVLSPGALSAYVNEQSEIFTVQIANPLEPVTVTVDSTPPLQFSQSIFVLDETNTEDTFTVLADSVNSFVLSFTNDKGLTNPGNINFSTTIKPTLGVSLPVESIYEGQVSNNFTLTLINGDGPVIVTPASVGGTVSPTTITLTPAQPTGVFTVLYSTPGTKVISFTNNVGLVNPNNQQFDVLEVYNPRIELTLPTNTDFVAGVQSDLFTFTFVDKDPGSENIEGYVIVESPLGTQILLQYFLLGMNGQDTFNFTPTVSGSGRVHFELTGGPIVGLPAAYDFTVAAAPPAPTITITQPVTSIVAGVVSEVFTLTLVNGTGTVSGDLTTDAQRLYNHLGVENNTFSLTLAEPSKTFTVLYDAAEAGFVQVNTYGAIAVDPIANYNVEAAPVTALQLVGPGGLSSVSTLIDEESNTFSVTLVNPSANVLVTPTPIANVVITPASFTLTQAQPTATFTITPSVVGDFVVNIGNDSGITNPTGVSVNVPNPYITFNSPAQTSIETDIESGDFVIEMFNINTEVTYTIVVPAGVTIDIDPVNFVSANKIRLTGANRTGAFRLTSSTVQNFIVDLTSDEGYANPAGIAIGFTNDDAYWNNVTLLAIPRISDGVVEDISSVSRVITEVGSVNKDLANTYGGYPAIVFLDGDNTNYLVNNTTVGDRPNLNLGQAWTFDVTFKLTSLPVTTPDGLLFIGDLTSNVNRLQIDLTPASYLGLYVQGTGTGEGTTEQLGSMLIELNRVYHFSLQRFVDGTYQMSLDGVLGPILTLGSLETLSPLHIALGVNRNGGVNRVMTGRMWNPRLTLNTNRYNANFIPPFGPQLTIVEPAITTIDTDSASGNYTIQLSENTAAFNVNVIAPANLTVLPTASFVLGGGVTSVVFQLQANSVEGPFDISFVVDGTIITPKPVSVTVVQVAVALVVTPPANTAQYLNEPSDPIIVSIANTATDIIVTPYVNPLDNDPDKANITLMLDFQDGANANFVDISDMQNVVSVAGNATKSAVDPIYGLTSGVFDGTGDYLYIDQNLTNFHFPGDFTIEVDFKTSNASKTLFDAYSPTASGYYQLWINGQGKLEWYTSPFYLTSISSVNTDTVVKGAISRVGNTTYLFVNGFLEAQITDTNNYSPNTSLVNKIGIGAQISQRNAVYDFAGKIGKVKVTKGVGKFSNNYEPETLHYPTFVPETITLSSSNLSDSFTVANDIPADVLVHFKNDSGLTNPDPLLLSYEKVPTIEFTGPIIVSTDINQSTGNFLISLVDPSLPVGITVTVTPSAGVTQNTTGFSLDASVPAGVFNFQATDPGVYTITITNDSGLTNPMSIDHAINDPAVNPSFVLHNDFSFNMIEVEPIDNDFDLSQTIII